MLEIKNFHFQTNVSVDSYQSKTDATACLSSKGAEAIGMKKMAFRVQSVTVGEFLNLAVSGHAFCNLFQFNPDKLYWFQNAEGKWLQQYPVYRRGTNKGAMKLCMKADKFFMGAQTVFVDVDYTRFDNITDYLSTLTYPPTCVYMSFSDKKEKQGRTSRRFRMVYVFDQILDEKQFKHISQSINDQIVFDTSEAMDDDCGTRMSQYMNGVYGNSETYSSNYIYSVDDFPEEQSELLDIATSLTADTQHQDIVFDDRMYADMRDYSTRDFLHYYSWKYPYQYRTEKPDWIDGKYQLTDDNYLQLWWYREKQVDGQHRRRKLFKNACLRRLMFPDMTPDAALYNLYIDFVRFFDNSDGAVTPECLRRKVKLAFQKTHEQLTAYCNKEIQYWHDHHPQFIIKSGFPCNWGVIADIKKRIRWAEISNVYDTSLSVQQNIAKGVGIPQSTLYRYCKTNLICCNPGKGQTEAERRSEKRQDKQRMIEQFKSIYNPCLSVTENQTNLSSYGISLSRGTISNWSHKYITPQQQVNTESVPDFPVFKVEIPDFDIELADYDIPEATSDEHVSEDYMQIEGYSWFTPDCNWSF